MRRELLSHTLILTVMTLAFAGLAKAQESSGKKSGAAASKAEVMKTAEERNQALQKGDVETLDRIYTSGLVYVNPRGELLTKAEHLAQIKARTVVFQSIAHRDVRVHVHGNTAVVTGITTSAVMYKGTVDNNARRFTNVYVKQGGQWLCAAHIEGPMPKQ